MPKKPKKPIYDNSIYMKIKEDWINSLRAAIEFIRANDKGDMDSYVRKDIEEFTSNLSDFADALNIEYKKQFNKLVVRKANAIVKKRTKTI